MTAMDLIKKISSSEDLPEIKIIEFDTFSDLRGKICTSFIDELSQKLLPDNIYFKHDKFNTNKKGVLRGFMEIVKLGSLFHVRWVRLSRLLLT